MADGSPDTGLRSGMRRAVGGALDATVGRVGHTVTEAAMDVTGATAQQIIEDLEPYLISEAIPRIVDGLTPYDRQTSIRRPIQSRHTPYRIRTGRIGTARDAARYSRLTPSAGGASRAAQSPVATCPNGSGPGDVPLGTESGWWCLTSSRQWHGGAVGSAGQCSQHA